MRGKIYRILKVTNECKSCEECPLFNFCEEGEGVCDYLEELDNKLIEKEEDLKF